MMSSFKPKTTQPTMPKIPPGRPRSDSSKKGSGRADSRVWLEISLERIVGNLKRIRSRVRPAKVMCVLKANGYGLGAVNLAQALEKGGADRFGVAELKEALALKGKIKVPIQLLSGILPSEIPGALSHGLVIPISTPEAAIGIQAEAKRQGRRATVHVKIDTGMGRMGLTPEQALDLVPKLAGDRHLRIEGIFSHFAHANQPEHFKSREQLNLFQQVCGSFERQGLRFDLKHMANSDAINNLPESYFDMVRTGINLYGVFDLKGEQAYALQHTLSLKTTLLARRFLRAGHQIGYGCTHTLFEDTWVGTVPAGYADGIPLAASNSAWVLINGRRCPIIGRVSMDYITVNLNGSPKARIGDPVVLVGRSGRERISIEDWARVKQTHPYEIICSLGPRVERIYLKKG
jgi:alanine racemase